MNKRVSRRVKIRGQRFAPRLRSVGRLALWAVLALLLIRGADQVIAGPEPVPGEASINRGAELDPASASVAIRFARTYLADPDSAVRLGHRRKSPAVAGAQTIAQAEVSGVEDLARDRIIVTVACEELGGRTLYLAVPIARSRAGEAAVSGAPSLVAAPEEAGVQAESSRPLSGAEAGEIGELVDRFLAAYLASTSPAELSYYLAPGAEVRPLGGGFALQAPPRVTELEGQGPERSVLASGRVTDEASGVSYPLAYRLELVRRERWYVAGVKGALR